MTMQGTKILARAIEIQNEICLFILFIYFFLLLFLFFKIEAFFITEKCMVSPKFLFGHQEEHLLSSAFSA